MGGGYTSRDVDVSPRSKATRNAVVGTFGGYSKAAKEEIVRNTRIHEDGNPKKNISVNVANPIAIAIDGTGSMGDSAFVMKDKFPLLYGQLNLQGYVEETSLSLAVVGDYGRNDDAPLQIFDFSQGDRIDVDLGNLFIEKGGGGNLMESYELAAAYYDWKCTFGKAVKRAFLFIIGDEGFYPDVKPEALEKVMDLKGKEKISTKGLFTDLANKMEVVFIQIGYGGGSWTTDHTQEINSRLKNYLPASRVLFLTEPRGVVDLILGATALLNGTRTLDGYVSDLKAENGIRKEAQTPERIKAIVKALTPLWDEIQKKGVKPKKGGRAELVHKVEE